MTARLPKSLTFAAFVSALAPLWSSLLATALFTALAT